MQFPIPDDSPALRRAIRVSQAVTRVRQLPTVFVANPLVAVLVASAYWDHADQRVLLGLVAAVTFIFTPAALSWRRLRHRPRPGDVSEDNERRAVITSTMAGLLWALTAYILFPQGGPEERAMLVMLYAGLTGGSVAFFSSSPSASLGYFVPAMSALFVRVVQEYQVSQPLFPAVVAIFFLAAILFTRTRWREFVDNVRILVERDEALASAKVKGGELETALLRMQDLAMVDELTGLKNRRAFFDDADALIAASRRRDQPVAFAVIDLDNFKDVNDTYGHAVGDVVLREAAARIVENFREEQLTGRFGGEEFVVLLPYTTPQQALTAVERVRRALSATPIAVPDGPEITITLSAGIAPLGDDNLVEKAIDLADKAMYRAKSLGRDRVEVFGV